ncbi:hypothetical protein [Exiguobacterium flavidum]|uniref:hypothetical protein n=1 Tax=Exiguobacterium flavidum TaxID=2184695 RepID=UPI0013003140|nr:hypothetical protein [Exiguobacterium flavidum]
MNPFTTVIALIASLVLLILGIKDRKWPLIILAAVPFALIVYYIATIVLEISR